jgi:hypothetical protein
MPSIFTRGPDRLFLVHHVLARLRGRGWFSAYSVAWATYWGDGRVHPQQRRRVRIMLEQYAEAGILERDDMIAACPLYRHRDVSLEDVDQEILDAFEKHANRRRMTPSYEMNLKMLDHHLDMIVPRDADPKLFNEHGHLKAWRERAKPVQERPRVLGYLGTESTI